MTKNKITVKEILEDKYIDFKNKYCNGEFSSVQECKRKGVPVMVCPKCDADFYYSDKSN